MDYEKIDPGLNAGLQKYPTLLISTHEFYGGKLDWDQTEHFIFDLIKHIRMVIVLQYDQVVNFRPLIEKNVCKEFGNLW